MAFLGIGGLGRSGALFVIGSLLFALGGCGESHTEDEDAGIVFDATPPPEGGFPDRGTDAPVSTDDIGQPCTSGADCMDTCVTPDQGFPGGYCAVDCTADGMCPDGSTCTLVGRDYSLCLLDCDPTATERTCRAGYGCASSFSVPNVCIPGCSDDTDCDSGLVCDPMGGFSGEGVCYDPDAMLGDACMSSMQCPAGGSCNSEPFSGWPSGACITRGCDVAANTGCPGDAQCLPGGRSARCYDGCATDDDCREGYACKDSATYPGRLTCQPACTTDAVCTGGRVCNRALGLCDDAFNPSELGAECSSTMGACGGGACLTEFDSGFPGSYCAYVGCDPGDGTGCPTGGVCVEGASGLGVCLEACTDTPDCPRDGYDCLPTDRADAASPKACLPACTTDASCANMGFECNEGTGLCRAAFNPSDLGDMCVDETMCGGGLCMTEPDDGWPRGACTYPGCRLDGVGGEPCPTGSACIDDERGDPDLGICVATCTVASSSCRTGYACTPLAGSTTDGTCTPACADDTECTDSRTCDTGTGLCG